MDEHQDFLSQMKSSITGGLRSLESNADPSRNPISELIEGIERLVSEKERDIYDQELKEGKRTGYD